MHLLAKAGYQPRIRLTKKMLDVFYSGIFEGSISDLARKKGLSYQLLYNLAKGRIKSLSTREYRIIFGEDPPYQKEKRVDGHFFREMVRLWLYLHGGLSEAELYRNLYPAKQAGKIDYRVFTGKIETVDKRVEKGMLRKFEEQGLSREEVEQWIREMRTFESKGRVPYTQIRPIIWFISESVKINPSVILRQWVRRYESGELVTVSQDVYERALWLKARVEKALDSGTQYDVEGIREEIYGKRKGLILFHEVEEELKLLKQYGRIGPRRYLGRSISHYRKLKLKRIASDKAKQIRNDCLSLVRSNPNIPARSLPRSLLPNFMEGLYMVLRRYLQERIIEGKGDEFERLILMAPYYARENGWDNDYDVTEMEDAPAALGMSRGAFDLLVARNRGVFRKVTKYYGKWCLPREYLAGLAREDGFVTIKETYENLACRLGKKEQQS